MSGGLVAGIDPGTKHVGFALVQPGTDGLVAKVLQIQTFTPDQFVDLWWDYLTRRPATFSAAAIEDFTLSPGTPNLGRLTVVELLGYVRYTHRVVNPTFTLRTISRSERSVSLHRYVTDQRIDTANVGRADRHGRDAAAVAIAAILRSNRQAHG